MSFSYPSNLAQGYPIIVELYTGLPGPQGPQGQEGPQGPQGPAGAPPDNMVTSVNGIPGPDVVLTASDVGAISITDTISGGTY